MDQSEAPGFTLSDVANLVARVWVAESNLSANCAARMKVFRRKPDGTELLVVTRDSAAELTTSSTANTLVTGTLAQTTTFAEDDRLIIRMYIINVGTMAVGYLGTVRYDPNAALGTTVGYSTINLLDGPELKLESDPGGSSRIPGGLTMGGVGN